MAARMRGTYERCRPCGGDRIGRASKRADGRTALRPHESADQRRRHAGADAGRRDREEHERQHQGHVYPSSQLGKLQELAEMVSTGTIALSHNTAGGIGSLYEPFGALDTPYLYRDIDHLMKVMDVNSPVMQKLNDGLIKAAGVRVIYAYYFGTRQLTANKAVLSPADLVGREDPRHPVPHLHDGDRGDGRGSVSGRLVRGADRRSRPARCRAGKPGQRRAVVKLYEMQSHLMLTGHIMNAQLIVINEKAWQELTPEAARRGQRRRRRGPHQGQRDREKPGRGNREAARAQDDGDRTGDGLKSTLQGVRRQARGGEVRREVRRPLQGDRGDQVS